MAVDVLAELQRKHEEGEGCRLVICQLADGAVGVLRWAFECRYACFRHVAAAVAMQRNVFVLHYAIDLNVGGRCGVSLRVG